MHTIKDIAHRLTNKLQAVIGFIELEQYGEARAAASESIKVLHQLSTGLAMQAAKLDLEAAEVQQLPAEASKPNPPHSRH